MFDICMHTHKVVEIQQNTMYISMQKTDNTKNTGSHSLISINKPNIILAAVYEYYYYYSFSRLPTIFFNNMTLI